MNLGIQPLAEKPKKNTDQSSSKTDLHFGQILEQQHKALSAKISATDSSHKTGLRRDKFLIEDIEKDENEEESETVILKKVKKKIKNIIALEQKFLGL